MHAIWGRGGVRGLLTVLPVVLTVVFPIVYYVAVSLLPEIPPSPAVKRLLWESVGSGAGSRQVWMAAFTTLICPALYLCVPVLCGVGTASCVFVSEKEERTMESLFLSAMNGRSIFNAKVTACVLLSVAISWVSFLIFSITVSIIDLLLSAPYFFSLEWLMIALLVTPALALFSVVFVSLILPRVRGVGEALQTMGYLILPFLLLYLAQLSGAFQVRAWLLVLIAVALAVLAVVLFNVSNRKFQAEDIVRRENS